MTLTRMPCLLGDAGLLSGILRPLRFVYGLLVHQAPNYRHGLVGLGNVAPGRLIRRQDRPNTP